MLRGLAGVMARNVALRYGVLQHYGGGVAGQAALRRVLTSCAVWLRVLRGMVRGVRVRGVRVRGFSACVQRVRRQSVVRACGR